MQNQRAGLARFWLITGVSALAVAGLFACVLVIARTPSLASLPLFTRLFHQALVVHVDLSVLVWFLATACMGWSLGTQGARLRIPYIEESALICFALGMLGIAASPLDPKAEAMMSNYIPVIHSPVFFMGLSLIFMGLALMLLKLFLSKEANAFTPPIRFGLFSAGLIAAIALAAFYWSHLQMPPQIEDTQYYELTFWGGGHVLQFTHTQIMMVAWLLLTTALSPAFKPSDKLLHGLFAIGLIAALLTPIVYLLYEVTSQEHRLFFTHVMIALGGIAPVILAWVMLPTLWRTRSRRNALWSTCFMSVVLFVAGGALGGMIEGQNVVIPAHYHGSIVGVTIGFMGMAWLLLPSFGYRDVSQWKMAWWQPIVYGGGQLLHIAGLAWSGGYGVLRKTPGVVNEISPAVKAAMGLMGLGGLLAIIGGLLFVIVTIRAMRKPA